MPRVLAMTAAASNAFGLRMDSCIGKRSLPNGYLEFFGTAADSPKSGDDQ
jgi:hypothetical protein